MAPSANTTCAYDLADRLLTIVLPGPGNTTTTFTLDALGRIATRTPPGGSAETYAYLGTSETACWLVVQSPELPAAPLHLRRQSCLGAVVVLTAVGGSTSEAVRDSQDHWIDELNEIIRQGGGGSWGGLTLRCRDKTRPDWA